MRTTTLLLALIVGNALCGALARPLDAGASASQHNRRLKMQMLPYISEIQDFPYLALVARFDPTSGNVTNTCMGASVETGWRVVTSRQCILNNGTAFPVTELKVYIHGVWHEVSALTEEPGTYPPTNFANPPQPSNSLAVLCLMSWSAAPVAKLPVDITTGTAAATLPVENDTVWAAAWGVTEPFDQKYATYYAMTVRTAGTCAAKFTDTFCASGTGGQLAKSATGGPIVSVAADAASPDVLVGVVGWSEEINAAYHIRVSDKAAWLATVIP